jgi:hypothetical protein
VPVRTFLSIEKSTGLFIARQGIHFFPVHPQKEIIAIKSRTASFFFLSGGTLSIEKRMSLIGHSLIHK